jgi:hypothetical protein
MKPKAKAHNEGRRRRGYRFNVKATLPSSPSHCVDATSDWRRRPFVPQEKLKLRYGVKGLWSSRSNSDGEGPELLRVAS